jgi:hypothetical protein
MTIFNVRLGKATNSSSSHSMIFLPNAQDDYEPQQFGWDHFTVASEQGKQDYLAATIASNLPYGTPPSLVQLIVNELCGVKMEISEWGTSAYVDHQSLLIMPRAWDGGPIDRAFFEAFRSYLLQEGLVILGGNDNDEHIHPLAYRGKRLPKLPFEDIERDLRARWDPQGYWTLFNRETGAKIRFSFDQEAVVPSRSTSPDLVDLKLTDHCVFGCQICYMDSLPSGRHGNFQLIHQILHQLAEAQVFEIAFGGGEPTTHPDFAAILGETARLGMLPNFTTRDLRWLYLPELRKPVEEYCGGFALSVDSGEAVRKLDRVLNQTGFPKTKAGIHYVLGSGRVWQFGDVLTACANTNLPLTLLGFKHVGRGQHVQPHPHDDWLEAVQRVRKNSPNLQLSVDTAILDQFGDQIQAAGVPRWCLTPKEGAFSMYIDAVEQRLGPSSYHPESFQSFNRAEDILPAYRSFDV